MKTIIATLFLIFLISGVSTAQVDRITQTDSIKSGRLTTSFTINSRHNYNTIQFDSLATTDSVRVWHYNEGGKKFTVALRNLNTWNDWDGNLITGLSGRYEFLILHPNLYQVQVEYAKASPTKTILLKRRGNNLK